MIKTIYHRLYSDFFLPDRMDDFRSIISSAKASGYIHLTLSDYYNRLTSSTIDSDQKIFLHRHDIDSDVTTARRFYKIEKEEGIKTSFYFRLNTIDVKLMRELHDDGFEVGYHFEELAQYCKDHSIFSRSSIDLKMDELRKIFTGNLLQIEKRIGFKIKTIASHGDFVNRKLNITNYAFINQELLDQCGLLFECYDTRLTKSYSWTGSDCGYPNFFKGENPLLAIQKRLPVVYLLTHPRHWHVAPIENLTDNIVRLKEGIPFYLNKK